MGSPQNTASITLEGLPQFDAQLRALDRRMQQTITGDAVTAGGKVVLAAVEAEVPIGKTRNLWESQYLDVRRGIPGEMAYALVGAAYPLGAHDHLVQQGTAQRFNRHGQNRGRMTPNPYTVTAYNASRDTALAVMTETLQRGIDQALSGGAA